MNNPTLAAAMDAFKPVLVERYTAQVQAMFDRLLAKFGPSFRGAGNDWAYARTWANWIGPLTSYDLPGPSHRQGEPKHLDAAKVAQAAAEYADAAVAAWADKIQAKLGELDAATVERMNGDSFRISGNRAGRRVEIAQSIIINHSSKGLPFNQFPARIALDGKPVSEAAYKRLAG